MDNLQLLRCFRKMIGVVLMLIAFVIFPDDTAWYYEVLVFDIGLVLAYLPEIKHRLVQLFGLSAN